VHAARVRVRVDESAQLPSVSLSSHWNVLVTSMKEVVENLLARAAVIGKP
jgi:hypothetical protein